MAFCVNRYFKRKTEDVIATTSGREPCPLIAETLARSVAKLSDDQRRPDEDGGVP
jgi:hypothetical protein